MVRELPAEGLQVGRHRLLRATSEPLRSRNVDATEAVAFARQHHVAALQAMVAIMNEKHVNLMSLGPMGTWVRA